MPVIISEAISEKGKADARRHRDKQKDQIRRNLPRIIGDLAVISNKDKKVIKIPIRSLDIPYFRPSLKKDGYGLGQGDGDPGDIIGRRSMPGKGDGKAGNQPGEDYLETEMTFEELEKLIYEDLGLPGLEEKEIKKILTDLGYKIQGHSLSGPPVLRDMKETAKEGIRRFYIYLDILNRETSKDKLTCFGALKKSEGVLGVALSLLKDSEFSTDEKEIVPFPILTIDDNRYYKLESKTTQQSQAVVIEIIDVSGSMSDLKKYFSRALVFVLTNFLRSHYDSVVVRHMVHDVKARLVDEEEIFKIGESGGTVFSSAYELANSLIDAEYPSFSWNIFIWHFSDGDNYFTDLESAAQEIKKLFFKGISMFGYAEVNPEEEDISNRESMMWTHFKKVFQVAESATGGFKKFIGRDIHFLGVSLRRREHIFEALKEFLDKRRWKNG